MKKVYGITQDLKNFEILNLAKEYSGIPVDQWPKEIEFRRGTHILILKSYDLESCLKKHRLLEKKEEPEKKEPI